MSEYKTAVKIIKAIIETKLIKGFNAFDASTILAVMYSKTKEETIDDLMGVKTHGSDK